MRKTRNQKLNLLSLENRLTPAISASLSAGTLSITGDGNSNTVLVSGTSGGFKVYNVAGDQFAAYQLNPAGFLAANEIAGNQVGGTFAVTANMNIVMGAKDDTVIVTVDDGGVLPSGINGGCTVSLNGGNDNVIVQSRNTIASSTGKIDLRGGAGADNFFIFGMDVAGAVAIDGGASGFRGGINSPLAPGDYFGLYASNTKAVNVVNAVTAIDDQYGPNTINGNLTVNSPTSGPPGGEGGFVVNNRFYPPGFNSFGDPGYNGLLVINSGSVVNGNVTYFGSPGTDGTYIEGRVNGNVSVNGGVTTSTGANDFVLGCVYGSDQSRGFAACGYVSGFYTAAGADGVDTASMLSGSYVGGPAQFNFRNGNNAYDLDHTFTVANVSASAVAFTITAGTGNDDVGRISGTIGTPGLTSNQVYNLGDGDNSLIWGGTFLGTSSSRFDYTTLGGADSLEMFNNNVFRLFASTGAGVDSITLGANFTASLAQLDFGAGVDSFTNMSVVVPVLINFP